MIQQFTYEQIETWEGVFVDFEGEDIGANSVFVRGGAFGVGDEDLLFRSFGPEKIVVEDYLDAIGCVHSQYTEVWWRWMEMYVLCLLGNRPQQSFEFAARSETIDLSATERYQTKHILR